MTELVLCMASVHPSWGYDRGQSAFANLGHIVSSNTIGNILKCYGIGPAPERAKRTSWRTVVKAHWDVMTATDFFTNEAWTPRTTLRCSRPGEHCLSETACSMVEDTRYDGWVALDSAKKPGQSWSRACALTQSAGRIVDD